MNSIKCPECGLVNFSTAPECKRCHLSFESQSSADVYPDSASGENTQYGNTHYGNSQYQNPPNQYWPEGAREERKRVFSGAVMVLSGILGVTMFLCVVQQVFHPLDRDIAKGVGGLIGVVGVLLALVAHFWAIVRIFEESTGWGIASLFIPFAFFAAVAQFWEKTKRSFVGQMVCVGIVFVGVGIGL